MFTSIVPGNLENVIFPGGEVHLNGDGVDTSAIAVLRGGDSDSLLQAAMWAEMNSAASKTLVMPYMVGARQDKGQPRGADVYARIINDMGARVIVTDPHSDYETEILHNVSVYDSTPYAMSFAASVGADFIIAPDAGAESRARKVADALGLPVFVAEKIRNDRGRILHYAINGLPTVGVAVAVDDICDGGATFELLANSLPANVKAHLWVTHGIFSRGTASLLSSYVSIACTDSHPGFNADSRDGITEIPIVADMLYDR